MTPEELAAIRKGAERLEGDASTSTILRLLDDIERLTKGLEQIGDAECCGCSVYSQIAGIYLDGGSCEIKNSGGSTDVLENEPTDAS